MDNLQKTTERDFTAATATKYNQMLAVFLNTTAQVFISKLFKVYLFPL